MKSSRLVIHGTCHFLNKNSPYIKYVKLTKCTKSIKYVCQYITKNKYQPSFSLKNNDELDEIEISESGRCIKSA